MVFFGLLGKKYKVLLVNRNIVEEDIIWYILVIFILLF